MTFYVSQQDRKTMHYCRSCFSSSREKDQKKMRQLQIQREKTEVSISLQSQFQVQVLFFDWKLQHLIVLMTASQFPVV